MSGFVFERSWESKNALVLPMGCLFASDIIYVDYVYDEGLGTFGNLHIVPEIHAGDSHQQHEQKLNGSLPVCCRGTYCALSGQE